MDFVSRTRKLPDFIKQDKESRKLNKRGENLTNIL